MNVEERLVQIVENASSPRAALEAAAAAIAQDELSDACAVFLSGPGNRLFLWARSGDGFDRTREAAEAVAREALARVSPAGAEHAGRAISAAPLLSHARPIGALVVERSAHQPYAQGEVRRLVAIASHIVGVIESARLLDMLVHPTGPALDATAETPPPPRGERVLSGIAASPGVAVGRCVFRRAFSRSLLRQDFALHGAQPERNRLRDAIEKTRNDLKRLQAAIAGELGEEHALIFASHLLFLHDPLLLERIESGISQGLSAAVATDRAQSEIVARLNAIADPRLRERIEDLEDLCSRILSHLVGAGRAEAPGTELVVSPQFTPSLIVELHGRGAAGVASELGGSTSHAVLLARALGFPAVTGVAGLIEHAIAGEPLVIDGDQGIVIVDPSAATIASYRASIELNEHARTEFALFRDRPAMTADGVRFALRANVAFGADIELARANNADGIGLYRTEFPFLIRDGVPTIEEQVRIYEKAYQAFPHHTIIFRILDLTADKLLPASGPQPAGNAFQGYRSIRVLFDHPHILRDQVRAFALAAAGRSLSIMIPMVTSIEELRLTKHLIAAALADFPDTASGPPPRVGVLIEVPAAVEIAGDLARESDFLSIGTNDLMQYSLVIDRDDPRLSTALDAYHPALWRMIRRVIVDAQGAGKEVSVCGEMAARAEAACALLALGVDALSVIPRALPRLKQRVARIALQPLKDAMPRILALPTAAAVEQAIRVLIDAPTDRA